MNIIYLKLFPVDEYHEIFLARKHDFLTMNYAEFKDLFDLPPRWFENVYKENPNFKYPGKIFLTVKFFFKHRLGASYLI